MISIYIIDDHSMVLEGLKALLNSSDDITVIGTSTSVSEAISSTEFADAQILILDDRLSGKSGIDSCTDIWKKHSELKIIILTSFMENKRLLKAIQLGVSGYLLKELNTEDLCKSVRTVAQGGTALPADHSINLSELIGDTNHHRSEKDDFELLNERELKIAELVSQGLINKEIADHQNLGEQTIKNYMTTIFSKLNITRRSQLAVLYEKHARGLEDSE